MTTLDWVLFAAGTFLLLLVVALLLTLGLRTKQRNRATAAKNMLIRQVSEQRSKLASLDGALAAQRTKREDAETEARRAGDAYDGSQKANHTLTIQMGEQAAALEKALKDATYWKSQCEQARAANGAVAAASNAAIDMRKPRAKAGATLPITEAEQR